LTKCCPKFLGKEHMKNGVHETLGRQVSTWAHAVKDEEVIRFGGSLLILSSSASVRREMGRLNCFASASASAYPHTVKETLTGRLYVLSIPLSEPETSILDLCVLFSGHAS
jgi:hypothetical protein